MRLINPNMLMSEVVEEFTSLIPVINRFGIRLGLADKSVRDVCDEYHLDVDFLLTVINTYLNEEYFPEKKLQTFHTSQIVDYLNKTNQYYLRYQLPNIERHLQLFISKSSSENASLHLIGKFFTTFKDKLIARIEQDEKEWFPYCLDLTDSVENSRATCSIDNFKKRITVEIQDDQIEALLLDLKRIMIKHINGDYNENLCYAVIFAISSLDKDIRQHNRIRYRILRPMVSAMEEIKK